MLEETRTLERTEEAEQAAQEMGITREELGYAPIYTKENLKKLDWGTCHFCTRKRTRMAFLFHPVENGKKKFGVCYICYTAFRLAMLMEQPIVFSAIMKTMERLEKLQQQNLRKIDRMFA